MNSILRPINSGEWEEVKAGDEHTHLNSQNRSVLLFENENEWTIDTRNTDESQIIMLSEARPKEKYFHLYKI